MARWISAFNDATVERRALTMRSLAALAGKRAAKIESAVQRSRLADYRHALQAPCFQRVGTVRAPSRLAFRYVRGISGWSRSPIADDSHDDVIPDADDIDDSLHESQVRLAAAHPGNASLAPLRCVEQGSQKDGLTTGLLMSRISSLISRSTFWARRFR